MERALAAQLVRKKAAGKPAVLLEPLRLFVQHGLRYCFPATRGGMTRGAAFYPLYLTVPEAAQRNPALCELLVLVDAIRGASLRERALAISELDRRWSPQDA